MPCYHFIYHGYGTWLPDQEDGYVKRHDGQQPQDLIAARRYRSLMTAEAVSFSEATQLTIIDEIHVASRLPNCRVHHIATEPTHVHIVVSWADDRPFGKLRAGIRQSISRRLSRELGQRTWLSKGGSRKRVSNQEHFDYLIGTYLPGHSGWKWSEERGLYR